MTVIPAAAELRGALPRHHRHDQMCWLSGNFSFNLSAALRGTYDELRIYPNGAAKLLLIMSLCPVCLIWRRLY